MTIHPHFFIEAATVYSKKDEDFIEKRSRENLVEVHREELLKVIEGYNCVSLISISIRRRMREEGILKKVGSKYVVTQLGREMLKSRGGGAGYGPNGDRGNLDIGEIVAGRSDIGPARRVPAPGDIQPLLQGRPHSPPQDQDKRINRVKIYLEGFTNERKQSR